MEQSGHLHGSLASFSMLSWLVLLAGSQQASAVAPFSPLKLSVSPPLSTFARGKQISLICSIPEGLGATVIFFHVKARDGGWTTYTRQLENTLDLNTTHLETTQTFSCSYLGEAFQSSLSNDIVISINDPQATSVPPTAPPAPRLFLSPSRSNFIQGEQILLTCSFPQGRRAKKFRFYEKNTNGTWTPYKSQAENTLNLSTTNNQTFVCSYEENNAGISAQSLQSNHVVISITGDVPSTPRPVFSSTTQTLPGSTVTKGRFTSITISTPTALQPGTTYTTKARPEFTQHHGSMTSTYSPSQSAVAYTTSTHPKFMVTSGSTTPTPITLTSTDPQNTTPSPASSGIAKRSDDDTPESEEGTPPPVLT
ncbi:mucin-2-like [Varanus komodoensis]|uniref:mucin-2-like n=1 Tax=Varanus komodoensis TaxID=61221 RepID=UPI001CF7841B|nr:mucin-2-like [Varanus komodoensis]